MKHYDRKTDPSAAFTVTLQLDVTSEQLGLSDGYRRAYGHAKKQRKTSVYDAADDCFFLTCRNTDESGCICEITARRNAAEWESLPSFDYYRYADALAARLISGAEARESIRILPHVRNVRISTPLDACLIHPEKATDRLLQKARTICPANQEMRIENVREHSGLSIMTLKRTDGFAAAVFRSGQYVQLSLNTDGAHACAPCLLCSSPASARNGIYKAVLFCGKDRSAWSSALTPGTLADISTPQGRFFYEPLRDCKTVIGISDHQGAAVFLSMAASICDGLEKFKLTLLYYDTQRKGFPFPEEYAEINAGSGSFRLIEFPAVDEGDPLSAANLKTRLPHEAYTVFVCGSRSLCSSAENTLKQLNLPDRNIRILTTESLYGQEEPFLP